MKIDIYTICSLDITQDEKSEIAIIESCTKKGVAVRKCVEYIVERVYLRPDIRYGLWHDELHPEIRKFVSSNSGVPMRRLNRMFAYRFSDGWKIPDDVEKSIKEFLKEEVGSGMGYTIFVDEESSIGYNEFIFGVANNTLGGLNGKR